MRTIIWKCMECESETRYKGLCRDCTIYDEETGEITMPIQRKRLNSDRTLWESPIKMGSLATKDMLKSMRLSRQKRPSKKQISLLAEEIKELQEAQSELSNEGEGLIEFGEPVEIKGFYMYNFN